MTDRRSAQAETWRKWYSLAAWKRARTAQLAKQPLCEPCLKAARVTLATMVDHITPHRGDWSLFIDPTNHQSICDHPRWRCHSRHKQQQESRGHSTETGADGMPTDPAHPFFAG